MTAEGRRRSNENLLRGPSPDPEIEARRRRGLRQGNETHGAYNQARRAPLEADHRQRLAAEFSAALQQPGGQDLLNSCAKRAAMLDLMAAWLADRGTITSKGDVAPPARELRHLLDAHERAITALAALERERGNGGMDLDGYLRAKALEAAGERAK